MADSLEPTTFTDVQSDIETVVGDEQQIEFYPRIKIKKWDNEVNLSVGVIADPADGTLAQDGDTITWESSDMAAVFYPAPESGDRGGYEFEIHLLSRPDSNMVPLSVQTKDLNFYYQPALGPEDEGCDRPENVIGSYAAYHVSKDGNQYETGKAFHIYRPWAEDSNGWRVWCDFDSNWDGITDLNIIIPQDFLDNAVYPVLIDPTFGYTTAGASSFSVSSVTNIGDALVGTITTGVKGTLKSIYAYVAQDSRIGPCLYKGDDFNLVTSNNTSNVSVSPSPGWTQVAVTSTQIGPCPYVVCVYLDSISFGGASIYYDTLSNAGMGVTGLGNNAGTDNNSVTNLASAGLAVNNNKYSVYGQYTGQGISRVSGNNAIGSSSNSSPSATYPLKCGIGNMLIASVYGNVANGNATISGWTLIQEAPINGNANSISIFAKVSDGTEGTVTASITGSSVSRIQIYEYTGLDSSETIANATDTSNTSNSGTTAGTSQASPTLTTTNANDLFFVAAGFSANVSTVTPPSWNNSVSTLQVSNRQVCGERVLSATGSYSSTASWTNSARCGIAAVALKEIAALIFGKSMATTGVGGLV